MSSIPSPSRSISDHSIPTTSSILWTWPRLRSFFTTLYLLTGAGIVYAFSSYATQLRDRLGFSQLNVSLLASCGNLGLYLFGPIVGYLIDKYNPRPVALVGTLLMFFGFSSITYAYYSADPTLHSSTISPATVAFYYFLLGCGSASVTLSSVSLNIRCFPPSIRGFAVGVPVSFYGLSAFIFVQIKQFWFTDEGHGSMISFFMFITIFLAISIVIAFMGFWDTTHSMPKRNIPLSSDLIENDEQVIDQLETSFVEDEEHDLTGVTGSDTALDNSLLEFFCRPRSWLLSATFFLAAGVGLMVIGNIGAVVLSLFPRGSLSTDISVQVAQASQVAVLSIFNAIGRIVSGIGSDTTGSHSRPWWLFGSLIAMTIATSLVAFGLVPPERPTSWILTLSTAIIGYGYGTIWSLCPSIVAEWVNPLRFGLIWGFMTLMPSLSQQITNIVFGAVYDAHRHPISTDTRIADTTEGDECHGPECYTVAYSVCIVMSIIGAICAYLLASRSRNIHTRLVISRVSSYDRLLSVPR